MLTKMKPTSSKGKSPWKVNKASRRAGGIVIPNGAVLVNQGLGKVKLEEDYIPVKKEKFPASVETENDVNCMATGTVGDEVEEGYTEEFIVTKVEPDNHMTSPERPQIEEDANCYSRSYHEEIESLKCTVKELSLQVDKQNQVIREMKSGLRNAVMSLLTWCKDEEDDDGRCHSSSSSDPQSQEESSRSVGEDSLPFEIPSGSPFVQSEDTQGNSELEEDRSSLLEFIGDDGTGSVDDTGSQNPMESSNQSGVSLESSFISEAFVPDHDDHEDEGEFESEQKNVGQDSEEDDQDHPNVFDNEDSDVMPGRDQDEDGEGDDNQEDDQGNEEDLHRNENSSQVLPSSSNRKEGDDEYHPRGNSIKRRRLPLKTQKTDKIKGSINNSKGKKRFKCSKCNSKFKLEIMMRDHQRRVHSKVKPSNSECHLCRKVYSTSRCLRRHVLSVHEGVCYKCEYCPRVFTESNGVRYHEDTVHKGDKMSGPNSSKATHKKIVRRLRKKK